VPKRHGGALREVDHEGEIILTKTPMKGQEKPGVETPGTQNQLQERAIGIL
jgi:hypothetical protein